MSVRLVAPPCPRVRVVSVSVVSAGAGGSFLVAAEGVDHAGLSLQGHQARRDRVTVLARQRPTRAE